MIHLSADPITAALEKIEKLSPQQTDGEWLEELTVECAPLIAEWDTSACWLWKDWPDKHLHFNNYTDLGADIVAQRKSDGKLIAIQCKSRKLDKNGRGNSISKREFDSFIAFTGDDLWAERWLVTNGDVRLGTNALETIGRSKKVTVVNLGGDLQKQREVAYSQDLQECPHCKDPTALQSRDCMQREAIKSSVELLRKHAITNNGKARGRIILPCGTGKSRIALRIIEEMTMIGEVSVILCPSIALVAQLRREFLANSQKQLKALAVCSDATAGRGSDLSKDPTVDISHTSASEVKGSVTTDPVTIRAWFEEVAQDQSRIGVIFGTYQSSHRIAEAFDGGTSIAVLVADEAHRTAGLRRIKKSDEQKLKDFTVCHYDERFPAQYRIYQTATPRVYNTGGKSPKNDEWVVRNMDDQTVFGVELYRKTYADAVTNGWLTDYRIIALGVNDKEAYRTANFLAAEGNKKLSTAEFMKGLTLALVMGGAIRKRGVEIRSSINFMNTIAKSKEMTSALQSETVRDWLQKWLDRDGQIQTAANFRLEHLDASSNVATREHAKNKLASATDKNPYGILNVGIFGEGTDAPSLSAVGFLEARKSPVDVIQAVGRVMRLSTGKKLGYIICPILIPPDTDAESWLRNSGPEDGWKELGQILLALRAHDSRIEDNLVDLMELYLPPKPTENVATMVTIGSDSRRVRHYGHVGKLGSADRDIKRVLNGDVSATEVFSPLKNFIENLTSETYNPSRPPEPHRILTGKSYNDGSYELREEGIQRDKMNSNGTPGPINFDKSKKTAKNMINSGGGRVITNRPPRRPTIDVESHYSEMLNMIDADQMGIGVNLLAKSGLSRNRAERDVNILEDSILESNHHLRQDELGSELDRHFRLNALTDEKRKKQADGCTIASLLLMNAAMLHQRIARGGWLPGITGLETLKNAPDAVTEIYSQWNRITRHDFLPVIEPAIEIIETIQKTGRREGLNRALRHLSSEAERIAESYADLGADHAGPLFNKVMGNQASDGAFFTRPVAASLLARLSLDATGENLDWTTDATWKNHRAVDLTCGSGTLLAGLLTEMKRRAAEQGANEQCLSELQKLAVEEVITGLDFNPVSLQLAAAQLTAGNSNVAYRKMRLYQMPYGPEGNEVRAGTLELLNQKKIVPRFWQIDFEDLDIGSAQVNMSIADPLLEDCVDAVQNTRIVIMNPPFTNRIKMGEKFTEDIRKKLRIRTDALEKGLVQNDPELEDFVDKNSIRPLFVALAEKCLNSSAGILAIINPTVALTATSGRKERIILARRFHIHTLLTCHLPGDINHSQHTKINESMIIAHRHKGPRPPTKIICLDRFPKNEREVNE